MHENSWMKHSWKTLKFVSSEDEEIIHTEDKNKGLTLFTSSDGKKKKKITKKAEWYAFDETMSP